ncbi:MAG: type II toxin-antitoxin system HipA family toxin, partial [Verrucomicrobiia bacterium]
FDLIWSYNPRGTWTNRHQMTINGKREEFTRADLLTIPEQHGIKDAVALLEQVADAVAGWSRFAEEAGVENDQQRAISKTHRLALARMG